ncbi:MAG: cyclophilin family peptidyl-prolyl cis-trans isomerase [Kiritimatiellia bacterium]|jgi:cyclophilin family peptidyl-prolyl cis-trans isomerase
MNKYAFLILGVLLACTQAHAGGAALADGIYASFETSAGDFTARLDYERAPVTVASFVGLAEGSRAWLNEDSGVVISNHFFDGITFHRVIDGFVIQGGGHDNTGSGGPGYRYQNEFHPDLRHDKTGMLSTANSGPWTNGSQFFITLGATPSLDDKHNVFGEIVDGLNIVSDIGSVATDFLDKPLIDVVMNAVRILRIGTAAEAFDVHAQGLPDVVQDGVLLNLDQLEISFTKQAFAHQYVSTSTDLFSWLSRSNFFHEASSITATHTAEPWVIPSQPRAFFSLTRVQYDANAFVVPTTLVGKDLDLRVTLGIPGAQIIIRFSTGATGLYASNLTSFQNGTLDFYTYSRDLPYVSRIRNLSFDSASAAADRLPLSGLNLSFPTSADAGFFTATLGGSPVAGSFTTQDIP